MKIYCAAPWVRKPYTRDIADWLRSLGLNIISKWHHLPEKAEEERLDNNLADEALMDFHDMMEAEILIYLNLQKSEGKATELGIALARGIPIYVVGGKVNNVFLHLPQINHKDSLDEVVNCLLT